MSTHENRIIKPRFITFTGADDHTDIDRMVELSGRYNIEWAILFSPKRQGHGRYPTQGFINRVLRADLNLAAHLCGQHSRDVLEVGACPVPLRGFTRVQINSASENIDPNEIKAWATRYGVAPILQSRNEAEFPRSTAVAWLYDRSGGRGVTPSAWPAQHPQATCGFAGGIGPHNVLSVIGTLRASDYWIYMENQVRDEQDRFCLDRCEAVCRAVYDDDFPDPCSGAASAG